MLALAVLPIYAILQKQVVFANVVLQTLNVLRPSPENILFVKILMVSADNVGNTSTTQCAEKIKSAVISMTLKNNALNAALILKTAARGKMANRYAIQF
jgi:hypothetical protein